MTVALNETADIPVRPTFVGSVALSYRVSCNLGPWLKDPSRESARPIRQDGPAGERAPRRVDIYCVDLIMLA